MRAPENSNKLPNDTLELIATSQPSAGTEVQNQRRAVTLDARPIEDTKSDLVGNITTNTAWPDQQNNKVELV